MSCTPNGALLFCHGRQLLHIEAPQENARTLKLNLNLTQAYSVVLCMYNSGIKQAYTYLPLQFTVYSFHNYTIISLLNAKFSVSESPFSI